MNDPKSCFDYSEFLQLESYEQGTKFMYALPRNLTHFSETGFWKNTLNMDLIFLIRHQQMPSTVKASIIRELKRRKLENHWFSDEEISNLSSFFWSRMMDFVRGHSGLRGGEICEIPTGVKLEYIQEHSLVKNSTIHLEMVDGFGTFPDFKLIESMVYDVFDEYNWNEKKSCWRRANMFEALMFIANNSNDCRIKILEFLKQVCDKNESMWINSQWFHIHSGAFQAIEFIEKGEVENKEREWKWNSIQGEILKWELINQAINDSVGKPAEVV